MLGQHAVLLGDVAFVLAILSPIGSHRKRACVIDRDVRAVGILRIPRVFAVKVVADRLCARVLTGAENDLLGIDALPFHLAQKVGAARRNDDTAKDLGSEHELLAADIAVVVAPIGVRLHDEIVCAHLIDRILRIRRAQKLVVDRDRRRVAACGDAYRKRAQQRNDNCK